VLAKNGINGSPVVIRGLAIILILFSESFIFSEASYRGLTPGASTKAQVDSALGQPVRPVSETLFEYAPQEDTEKIYVQFRKNGMIADRIETFLNQPRDRSFILSRLALTSTAEKSRRNARGKLEEYFGATKNIVLTYSSDNQESGVTRVGYYSSALYALAVKQSDEPVASGSQRNNGPVPASPPPAAQEASPRPPISSSAPSYEDLTAQAWNAMLTKDFSKALSLLQDATRNNPEKPAAYSLLGVAYLYGFNDIMSAEKAMRQAIEKGDKALVRVLHDHDGFFQTSCYGWLSIGRSEIIFKSDDGQVIEMNKSTIKEAEPNKLVGANYFAFHIKVKSNKNLNFAPGTLRKPEANLILSLIKMSGD
jgi:tetratricopeptide (TPR) repeat protein